MTTPEPQPTFQIEKIYVKDLSLELPHAPQVFLQTESPQLEVQVHSDANQFADGLFQVVVTVTVTARAGDKTLFLAEAAQAGIFSVRGVPAADLDPLLGIACPNILYPYVRETISDLVTRGGFPPVLLAPVSFEAIYAQRQQAAAGAAQPQAVN
ncbi:MAG: protein-export chaperone SecB [Betaproteobacteria bacterium RIFCSPLOWO2_02_67_12]|nr:MAG: protein-export chaperone SecB [Betaproteobacteria bacterium RIFCSPLOWO2_02_67_12]OGA27492.1 MAG: protein-export chaperone SecB [Betaproteobacteria bacterium RIFCSPLOWO2_02_FULL_68_150]OGA66122.1 MAG: protein-export chaperone SecB [Betaproteobacteria bacterium RIFCSPLOWO2_12_FULL_67_28]